MLRRNVSRGLRMIVRGRTYARDLWYCRYPDQSSLAVSLEHDKERDYPRLVKGRTELTPTSGACGRQI